MAEDLKEPGVSAAELARKLECPPTASFVILIVASRYYHTLFASRGFFGRSAEFWLNLQSSLC